MSSVARILNQNWHHFLLLLLLIMVFLLQNLYPNISLNLRFDREYPNEWWRYLSCHLVHLNFYHASMNFLGLVLLSLCFFRETKPIRDISVFFGLVILTSIGLYFFSDLQAYVGLSGALHGYWFFYLLVTFERTRLINALFVGLLISKVLLEYLGFYDHLMTEQLIGGVVATLAHVYGVISGLILFILIGWINHSPRHD